MNNVLAIQSMNLFCINCQEVLHPVCARGGGAGGPRDHRGAATQSRRSYSHSH